MRNFNEIDDYTYKCFFVTMQNEFFAFNHKFRYKN